MNLYNNLSSISFLKKSYTLKFFFVAFLGIHIPLIGLIFTVVLSKDNFSSGTILLATLLLTLIATGITLYVINKLIKPIEYASRALVNYKTNRDVPNLPMHYEDEAGLLLSNIQDTINENENYLVQKQDLIYLLTHDIKNFASQPISLANLILEEDDAASRKEYANLIIDSSSKQVDFLEAFISLLKEEEEIAKTEITKRKISMKSVIATIEEQLELKLTEKEIKLDIDCKLDEVVLYINELLLTRVLYNLISNAIKFSHPESEIKVSIKKVQHQIEIHVEDAGIGFDNSKKALLFDKFSSMGRMGTAKETTTGIGLYLCSQIVKKFHGTIDASSLGENKGATFKVDFELFN